MQVFNIRPDGFKEIKKKMLIKAVPMILIAAAAGITIGTINLKKQQTDVNILPFIIPIVALSVGFGLYRSVNRQKVLVNSYKLTITDNSIIREQFNTDTISLKFNEIKAILKNKNGSFIIRGKNISNTIGVYAQIENYVEVEKALEKISPIVIKDKVPFLEKYRSFVGLFTIALMVCVYAVDNKIIVAIAGSTLVALMIWSFIKIRTNKNIDKKTKKGAWLILIVLASVIATMFFKLTSIVDM
jgi:hypothetical protein